jgi:hypothetical protein
MMLRRDIVTLLSVLPWHPCEHSRINILQWILTKLGTYLAHKRIWNPIFKVIDQRSRSLGQIFRRGDMPRFALPLFLVKIHWRMLILECSQGCHGRTDSSVTISLRNIIGGGIIKQKHNIIHVFDTTICKQTNYDNYKTSSELFLKSFFFLSYICWQCDQSWVTGDDLIMVVN